MQRLDANADQVIDWLEERVENESLSSREIYILEELISIARSDLESVLKAEEKPRELSPEEQKKFLIILEKRFSEIPRHYKRPEGVDFPEVKAALQANPRILYSLFQMEMTGGEPDIFAVKPETLIFADFSEESPLHRRCQTYGWAVREAKEYKVKLMDCV